jgi:hypothetical protein
MDTNYVDISSSSPKSGLWWKSHFTFVAVSRTGHFVETGFAEKWNDNLFSLNSETNLDPGIVLIPHLILLTKENRL